MINGEYRSWKNFRQEKTAKVEKSHRTFDKHEETTEPIVVELDIEDEEESETEESWFSTDYEYDYYTWDPDESTQTFNESGDIELTLTRVKRKVIGYNNKGELKELETKPKLIKIV
jgi:hypothetical protein